MTNDNYKAPASSLLDLPEPAPPPRPRNVNVALGLIGLVIVIHVLKVFKALQDTDIMLWSVWALLLALVEFALLGVICQQIARGMNWARWLLLLITLFTFAQICWAIGYAWRVSPEMWEAMVEPPFLLGRVLPMVICFAALHLLFFSSGDWFESRKAAGA